MAHDDFASGAPAPACCQTDSCRQRPRNCVGGSMCMPSGLQTRTRASPLGSPLAPRMDPRSEADQTAWLSAIRLMAAGEAYELALEAFTRAALDHGLTAEVLSGMGSANLGLRPAGPG